MMTSTSAFAVGAREQAMRQQPDAAERPSPVGSNRPERRWVLQQLAGLGLATTALPLLGGCSSSSSSAGKPAPDRVYRVGWALGLSPAGRATDLATLSAALPDGRLDALSLRFVDRLAELGYVEGQNLRWEVRWSPADQRAATAAEVVAAGVDVIVTFSSPLALRAAFEAPGSTPVVFCAATIDPVGEGYAQSLARPGGKVTGVTVGEPAATQNGKRLEVYKDVLPALRRLGVLLDVGAENAFRDPTRATLPQTAASLGLELVWQELGTLDELEEAVAALARGGAEAIYPVTRPTWHAPTQAALFVAAALRHRLPTVGGNIYWPPAGALCVYAPNLEALWTRAAEYVDKVLRGARPGDIPIEQPSQYHLVINKQTADTLGLTIPADVLARATEVIQ
jgi:putative tryptophan/tyrosine transport system substrate-binding protein